MITKLFNETATPRQTGLSDLPHIHELGYRILTGTSVRFHGFKEEQAPIYNTAIL